MRTTLNYQSTINPLWLGINKINVIQEECLKIFEQMSEQKDVNITNLKVENFKA